MAIIEAQWDESDGWLESLVHWDEWATLVGWFYWDVGFMWKASLWAVDGIVNKIPY